MPRQALAKHDLPRVIHPHRVKHVLCEIDPEDGHLLLHGTHLLWLNGFPNLLELIVAHCRRSAQGRVHFITTLVSGSTSSPVSRAASCSTPLKTEKNFTVYSNFILSSSPTQAMLVLDPVVILNWEENRSSLLSRL